jgi:hypothetical protein
MSQRAVDVSCPVCAIRVRPNNFQRHLQAQHQEYEEGVVSQARCQVVSAPAPLERTPSPNPALSVQSSLGLRARDESTEVVYSLASTSRMRREDFIDLAELVLDQTHLYNYSDLDHFVAHHDPDMSDVLRQALVAGAVAGARKAASTHYAYEQACAVNQPDIKSEAMTMGYSLSVWMRGPQKDDRSYPSIVKTTRNLTGTVLTPAAQQPATTITMPPTLSDVMNALPVSEERSDAQAQDIMFLAAQAAGLSGFDEVMSCFQVPTNSADDQAGAVPVEAQSMERHHEHHEQGNLLQREKPGDALHADFHPLSKATWAMQEELASEFTPLEAPSTSCQSGRAADANTNRSATGEGAIQQQASPTGPMMQISNTEHQMAEKHSLGYSLRRENTPTPSDFGIHAVAQADVVMDETTTEPEPKGSSTDAIGVRLLQLSGTVASEKSKIQPAKFQPVVETATLRPKQAGGVAIASQPTTVSRRSEGSTTRVRKEPTSTQRAEQAKRSHGKPFPAADDMENRKTEHHPASGDAKKQKRQNDSRQPSEESSRDSRSRTATTTTS